MSRRYSELAKKILPLLGSRKFSLLDPQQTMAQSMFRSRIGTACESTKTSRNTCAKKPS